MHRPTTATELVERADEDARDRDLTVSWLRLKLALGTAGLDPYDVSVVIVEVSSPDRAYRLGQVGQILEALPHVLPDRSTCVRVHALIEADVRLELGLDEPDPPTLDAPLASRALRPAPEASNVIALTDVSRRAGRTWQR